MNWKAANEQQDEARWRVFLMFVAMALMVIRTGLVSRGLIAALGPHDAPPASDHGQPVDVRQATLVLLCLAEFAGWLVIAKERAVWELMNRPLPGPAPELTLDTAIQHQGPAKRLDTS